MKKILVIMVLCLFVLASGCSYYRAKKNEKQAYEQVEKTQQQAEQYQRQMDEQMQQVEQVQKTASEPSQPSYKDDYDEEADKADEVMYVGDDNTGFKSLGTQYRDKEAVEHCDMDQPFTCMSYIASEGRVDITLKYASYQGALKEVTLYMDGDMCDPSGSYIEPGDKQKFTCYADETSDYVSGHLEIEYYETLKRADLSATGSVYTLWE